MASQRPKQQHEHAEVTASVANFLRQGSAYPERPQRVEVRETHISLVFLTDTRAYKLKKPVTFDFLDFSAPELRRQACQDELRLNRRLAPDVYLEVVPITADPSGRLALDGDGEQVDWLVKMRRLPDDQSLSAMIVAGRVSPDDVRRVADRLSRFYNSLSPVSLHPDEYRREIEQHVRANRQTLLEVPDHFADATVKRVHTAQLRFLHSFPEVFDSRVCDGRIVDGHGDLRAEHIYLTPTPVVIDCIEFNAEFRQLDVLDELCFLAMECAHLNAAWIGERIIERYVETSGDRPLHELRAFYTAYRACVRAKVNLLRANQLPSSGHDAAINEASHYLNLADEVSHELGPPAVLVVRGPAGVGKSTLAAALADLLAMEHLQTDAVRRELFGAREEPVEYNQETYSVENRRRVYQEMLDRAQKLVSSGLSVVLDGTFLTNDLQRDAVKMAGDRGAQPLLVNCHCRPETAAARIEEREHSGDSLSEARAATHERQLQEQQPPPPDMPQCHVDTSRAMPMMTRTVLDALKTQTPWRRTEKNVEPSREREPLTRRFC